jgi:hypothetical protein
MNASTAKMNVQTKTQKRFALTEVVHAHHQTGPNPMPKVNGAGA